MWRLLPRKRQEIFGSDDETDTPASDQNATDTLMQELFGSDDESEDNAHPQSTATERRYLHSQCGESRIAHN